MQMSSPVRQLTLNSFQLRDSDPVVEIREQVDKNKLPFILGLIDVNDTFNVGTAFRLADAMGVKELILFGKTECPPNPRIDKASVGTHKWVNWKYVNNVNTYIDQFRIENPEYKIIAVEQSSASISIYNSNLHFPVLLLLGNETAGIDDAILQRCERYE